jgi:hypothetical protein
VGHPVARFFLADPQKPGVNRIPAISAPLAWRDKARPSAPLAARSHPLGGGRQGEEGMLIHDNPIA